MIFLGWCREDAKELEQYDVILCEFYFKTTVRKRIHSFQ